MTRWPWAPMWSALSSASDWVARRKHRHDLEVADAADASDLAVRDTYLLYWDPRENGMAVNDGANGMQKVDFLIAEAGKRRLRLIVAFLDFWAYTGGAEQMRAWYGSPDKSRFFFGDPRTKRDYRTWVSHVVQRVNPLTGLAYRDDPTIMAWELMNEGNARPEGLRLIWTAEMSAYVKSLDPNHLVSSGLKLSDLMIPALDFGTWHGYPALLQAHGRAVQRHDHRVLPVGGPRQEAGPSGGIRLRPLRSGLGRGLRHVARYAYPRSQLRWLGRVAAGVAARQRTLSRRRTRPVRYPQ
jgi:hypothetical protein